MSQEAGAIKEEEETVGVKEPGARNGVGLVDVATLRYVRQSTRERMTMMMKSRRRRRRRRRRMDCLGVIARRRRVNCSGLVFGKFVLRAARCNER
jgi:hypothetical protein